MNKEIVRPYILKEFPRQLSAASIIEKVKEQKEPKGILQQIEEQKNHNND